jgi:hypothetical protein
MRYLINIGENNMYCVIDTWRNGEVIWQSFDQIKTKDYANEVNRINQDYNLQTLAAHREVFNV